MCHCRTKTSFLGLIDPRFAAGGQIVSDFEEGLAARVRANKKPPRNGRMRLGDRLAEGPGTQSSAAVTALLAFGNQLNFHTLASVRAMGGLGYDDVRRPLRQMKPRIAVVRRRLAHHRSLVFGFTGGWMAARRAAQQKTRHKGRVNAVQLD